MPTEPTSASGQALPVGTRLEEFEVERVLGQAGGEGGGGQVNRDGHSG